MACELTTGFGIGCKDGAGGIREFYIAEKTADLEVTDDVSGIATAITGTTFYKYEPRRETSNWTETPTPNEQNGSVFYAQTAQIILTKMEQRKRNEIVLLAQNNLVMIVKDENEKYWLLGEKKGITLVASPSGSGTAMGDRNGYELNFETNEPAAAIEVELAAFSDIISEEVYT